MDERCDLLCVDAPQAEEIRRALLGDGEVKRAAGRARAFSDPTRLGLAAMLGKGEELCVCDLAWISGRKQALVSHHLRVLRSEGLAGSRREGKMVMYSLTEEGRSLLGALLGEKAGLGT